MKPKLKIKELPGKSKSMCVHMHTCRYRHSCTHTNRYAHICTHTRMHLYTHTNTHTHTHMHR